MVFWVELLGLFRALDALEKRGWGVDQGPPRPRSKEHGPSFAAAVTPQGLGSVYPPRIWAPSLVAPLPNVLYCTEYYVPELTVTSPASRFPRTPDVLAPFQHPQLGPGDDSFPLRKPCQQKGHDSMWAF